MKAGAIISAMDSVEASPLLPDASAMFASWEVPVEGWEGLQHELNGLGHTYPSARFVWRGQGDAGWGLTSALFRILALEGRHVPTESDLVAAERRLLHLARSEWRLDGVPGLQLLARMQHVGVPTRLIDVTLNPLIAAWFAVRRGDADGVDARLFAFAVDPGKSVQLNTAWNSNTPYWLAHLKSERARRDANWGTGLGRRVWRPPALHERIPAQNAAFLLDGVPIDAEVTAFGRTQPEVSAWTAAELRTFSSIPLRLTNIRRGHLPLDKGPVFTYRISAGAKQEIRQQLEDRFGYSFATIYADIEGLAEYLRLWPAALLEG